MLPNLPLLLVLVLLSLSSTLTANPAGVPEDQEVVENRIAALIKRMTLEEKVDQLRSMVRRKVLVDEKNDFSADLAKPILEHGSGYVSRTLLPKKTAVVDPDSSDENTLNLEPVQAANLANAVQRYLIENTRLGIPALMSGEGLHGLMARGATSFPQAIALASTWDPELQERIFGAVAKEARARGMNWLLAPVLDVARDPRWGRTEETYGEDPFLASRMGVAAILGLQGRGPYPDKDHVIATAKHFAAHGQPEGGTNTAPANYSIRIIREQFFPPFESAVREAKVGSVMASYNEIDGIPSHVNKWLLGDVLRSEWGFRGFVCSDGDGITQLVTRHHVAKDAADAARQALLAGVEVELDSVYGNLIDEVKAGQIPESRIDSAVADVLRKKFAMGLFDHPYVDAEQAAKVINSPEHRALALEAARKAVVLLKNEGGILPLDRTKLKSIAVIGPNAADLHVGAYSFNPAPGVTVLDGIKQKLGADVEVHYAEGCRITEGEQGWRTWFTNKVTLADPAGDTPRIAEAVETARASDVAVVVIGNNEAVSREAWTDQHLGDRDDLNLPGRQTELVRAVLATGKPTVVLLINGAPLSIGEVAESAPAILEGFYLGEETGVAVADILFGDVNPGGKLPITFPRNVGQLPDYYYQKPTAKRSFAFSNSTPLYPFGFGLSYTTFGYENLKVSPAKIHANETATVSVDITNTGSRAGDEVAQLYIHQEVASVTRPVKLLRGFQRISLAPGERKTVHFTLGPKDLQFLNREMKNIVEPGLVDVMVGGNSVDLSGTTLEVLR